MGALFALAKILFGKLPWCALAGGLAGIIVGYPYSFFQVQNPTTLLTLQEVVLLAVVLGLVAWLFLLLTIGILLKYALSSIALQTFFTALLTAFLTIYVNNIINLPFLTVIFGMIIGILIGYLLCLLCRRYRPGLRG
jgi:hypothetical protein